MLFSAWFLPLRNSHSLPYLGVWQSGVYRTIASSQDCLLIDAFFRLFRAIVLAAVTGVCGLVLWGGDWQGQALRELAHIGWPQEGKAMGLFRNWFGRASEKDTSVLLQAIEHAVSGVEPLLKHTSGYPERYREPVAKALEYAYALAADLPGPVLVDRESYAKDAFVHVLFPSVDFVQQAFTTSRALQDYLREFPASGELYALMGMRRNEKTIVGMELSGQTIQRDVMQKVVYFTSHTIESPAPSEQQARGKVAWSFFDSLVGKVAARVAARKQGRQSQLQEKDMLMARLRSANASTRPALAEELSRLLSSMQSTIRSLELDNYPEDFAAVMLDPEQHIRLNRTPMILDSMGIRRDSDEGSRGETIIFNDLIGFDRRDWTVTMACCRDVPPESFAARLEDAKRKLVY
jgi:hypothetical protein